MRQILQRNRFNFEPLRGIYLKYSTLPSLLTQRNNSRFNQINAKLHSSNAATWDYDILIAGGGIVGATFVGKVMSSVSKMRQLKICIVDIRPPPSIVNCSNKVCQTIYLNPKILLITFNLIDKYYPYYYC